MSEIKWRYFIFINNVADITDNQYNEYSKLIDELS